MKTRPGLCALLLLIFIPVFARGGTLDDVRREIDEDAEDKKHSKDSESHQDKKPSREAENNHKDNTSQNSNSKKHEDRHRHENRGPDAGDLAAGAFVGILGGIFDVLTYASNKNNKNNNADPPKPYEAPRFVRYPYAGTKSILSLEAADDETSESEPAEKSYDAIGYFELGAGYREDNLWRGRAAFNMYVSEFGFNAGYDLYVEPRAGQKADTMSFLKTDLLFTPIKSRYIFIYLGGGVRSWLKKEPVVGGAGIAGFELFIHKPLVISAYTEVGGIKNALILGWGARLGVMLGRFDLGLGYDRTSYGSASLGGLSLSLRTWL